MEQGSQPYGALGGGFSSRACHIRSAAAAWVSLGMVSISQCSGRTGTFLTANDKQIPAHPWQCHWVFNRVTRVGFILRYPGSKSTGKVGLNEISAALQFPSKYLIRETFDFNNK